MAYTVKKLSVVSGVTVRTLHFYEEVGLLKPAYVGANGYRYYEEKELLQLQQILFFKELGFSLKQIQTVLGRSDFDQLAALDSHRQALSQNLEKTRELITTIDKTIEHLKGQKKMNEKEMFSGFSLVTIGTGSESYFDAEAIVGNSVRQPATERIGKAEEERIIKVAHGIYDELVKCLELGLSSDSAEVQRIIKKHHAYIEEFHVASKDVYKALAQLYVEHPEFRKQLDPFHPKLAGFMAEGMRVFANLIEVGGVRGTRDQSRK